MVLGPVRECCAFGAIGLPAPKLSRLAGIRTVCVVHSDFSDNELNERLEVLLEFNRYYRENRIRRRITKTVECHCAQCSVPGDKLTRRGNTRKSP